MTVRRFEELTSWTKAKELAVEVYRVTASGNFARDFALRDQLRRAAVSVMSNIAEGFERYSRPDFRRFLAIARASSAEIRCQVHLAHELGYLNADDHANLIERCLELSRLIAALRHANR